jgi:hypothetical protein
MNHNASGYVLIITIMMIAASTALLTAIVHSVFSYQHYVQLASDRQQARSLALSGIELARSQVSLIREKKAQEDKKMSVTQRWVKQFLPYLNRWQTVQLTQEQAGVDAAIQLYISCENGKIALNKLVEHQMGNKQEGADDNTYKGRIAQMLKQEASLDILAVLKDRTKEIGRPLEDPSELKINKPLFVAPDRPQKSIAVMDLFTTTNTSGTLNPWVFSQSLTSILGLKADTGGTKLEDMVAKLKPTMAWAQDWDELFGQFYGKKFGALPKEITALFAAQFEASAFSVVSYAKVGSVTQRVAALLETDEMPTESSSKNSIFKITKIYWL